MNYKEFCDKVFDLGFGATYSGSSRRSIDYEKFLNSLGEKYPPDCYFCAVNRHIDVFSPKNHEEHRGAAAVNYQNLIEYLEKLK